jgi:transcriptional regulator with XRE-family HTH domain
MNGKNIACSDVNENIRKNLVWFLEDNQMTQKDFANRIGLTPSLVQRWLTGPGAFRPKVDYILSIISQFPTISLDDLLFSDLSAPPDTKPISIQNDDEAAFLMLYRSLDHSDQDIVKQVMTRLSSVSSQAQLIDTTKGESVL